ncbi:ZHX1 protein, partial [Haliaeetus albicilla]|uniref:Zinc fingers and homeoboxes protein 1 n=1 Tax=Haliaeetus albicilla TaxID=8969 RepID=A0A091PIZ2_HALAL|nr:Zinc fingers and homeoboxes protein 1 [Haliaeetus albicilla]NWZ45841.1 ZHX1 protein [Haliaeetus albicilla]
MASKRKSTTPCMVLANEQDPDLEMVSDLEEGPPILTPADNPTAESVTSDEDVHEYVDSDNQKNTSKVEGGYECKYCTFQTPDLNMFTFHVDSEHPNVVLNSSYVCVECNFLTKRYDALSEHNLKYHPGEENFKLTMVKRNNQTIFEQTVNDLTFDGSFVREENAEQADSSEVSSSGISISKTPIMKMMKNKTESKRIAVFHNVVDDIPGEEKGTENEPNSEEVVENPPPAVSESKASHSVVCSAADVASAVVTPAPVLQPGVAQVITAVTAPQNSNLIPKVLIPVNSIPAYNTALDNNPLLLNTYNKFPYPTMSEITVLSTQAKYTEEQIKIWFSAQRLKHGVSWTPEEVEEARRKQFNGTVHTVPQTITVIPAHISAASNGLPSILQTCQIVGQPGLVLTQVAGANTLPVTAPIALTVAGVPNQTQLQKSQIHTAQPIAETKQVAAVPAPQPIKNESTLINPDSFGIRAKKTKEQLAELKVSYLKNQFPQDSEIVRLMKITGLTKGEIKKWFSDTRYNQRNSKNNHGIHLNSDSCKKSPEQLHMLKSSFVRTQWPSPQEYNKLAEETGLPRSEIVSWFGDTRYAWKNGGLKWYYYYQSANANSLNGQGFARKRGRGRPKGRGRGRPRGRPRGSKRLNCWDRGVSVIKFKTGTAILKDYYMKHKFLNEQDLDELVAKSHMGYEQVREWFAERQRRLELGIELFDENEEEDEMLEDQEDEEETDDSDTWEPPRHVKRKLSKSD